jgi:hypothetical protein
MEEEEENMVMVTTITESPDIPSNNDTRYLIAKPFVLNLGWNS